MSDRSHPSPTAGRPLRAGRSVATLVAIVTALALSLLLCFGAPAGLDPSAAAATTTSSTTAHQASSHPASSDSTPGSTQTATVQFNVCPGTDCSGIEVYVDTASCCFQPSSNYSLCTKDEGFDGRVNTYTRFYPKVNGDVHTIEMFAKSGYPGESCASERSYNTWIIKVSRNGKQIMRGVVWLGENVPVLAQYYAACGKYTPWEPAFENMTCTSTGTNSLTLSTPGALPPPNCSQSDSAATYCHIQLHLDAAPLTSPPFTPCLPSNSFNNPFGICAGSSDGTSGWTTPKAAIGNGIFSALAWCDLGVCTYKGERIALYAGLIVPFGLPGQVALIAATVPSAGSNQFKVIWAKQWPMDPNPRLYWATGTSGPPGTAGGPLLLNYQTGLLGSDVYLEGFLERKTMSSTPPGLGRVDPLVDRLTTALEQGTTSGDGPLFHSLFDLIQP
jgi:hypothetical protein